MIKDGRQQLLDASIARGLADADAGRPCLATEMFDRLAAKYRVLVAGGGMPPS